MTFETSHIRHLVTVLRGVQYMLVARSGARWHGSGVRCISSLRQSGGLPYFGEQILKDSMLSWVTHSGVFSSWLCYSLLLG